MNIDLDMWTSQWFGEAVHDIPAQLCSDSYTTLHGLCTTISQVLYDSFYDPTILSYRFIEKLILQL